MCQTLCWAQAQRGERGVSSLMGDTEKKEGIVPLHILWLNCKCDEERDALREDGGGREDML